MPLHQTPRPEADNYIKRPRARPSSSPGWTSRCRP